MINRLLIYLGFICFNLIYHTVNIIGIFYDLMLNDAYLVKINNGLYSKFKTFLLFILFENDKAKNMTEGVKQNGSRPVAETLKIVFNFMIESLMFLINCIVLIRILHDVIKAYSDDNYMIKILYYLSYVITPSANSLKMITIVTYGLKIFTKLWHSVLYVNSTYYNYCNRKITDYVSIPTVITELALYEIRITHNVIKLYVTDPMIFSYLHLAQTKFCGNLYCLTVMLIIYIYEKYIKLNYESMDMAKLILSIVDIIPDSFYVVELIFF